VKMSLAEGQLTAMGEPISMLEDPGVPLSPDIARLTGLTDADLAGQAFDEWALAGHLRDVDVLLAFNAAFDAPRLRRRFDWMIQPWCCALRDFDWAAAGWEGRTQHALLAHAGMFYTAHRAATDTAALAALLALTAPDGRTIAANIIDRGQRKTVRIAARGAPFGLKTALRARGYRWDSAAREWAIEVEQGASDEEERSLRRLSSLIRPTRQKLDWHERHTR
jgi:DNA polymerase III subunit epsilon